MVGADGRGSQVAKSVGAVIQEEHTASRAMYYRYAVGVAGPDGDPDGPEFSLGDDELVYLFPSDGGTSCVALSINLDDYQTMRSRARQAFEEKLAGHPFLAPRLNAATWTGAAARLRVEAGRHSRPGGTGLGPRR